LTAEDLDELVPEISEDSQTLRADSASVGGQSIHECDGRSESGQKFVPTDKWQCSDDKSFEKLGFSSALTFVKQRQTARPRKQPTDSEKWETEVSEKTRIWDRAVDFTDPKRIAGQLKQPPSPLNVDEERSSGDFGATNPQKDGKFEKPLALVPSILVLNDHLCRAESHANRFESVVSESKLCRMISSNLTVSRSPPWHACRNIEGHVGVPSSLREIVPWDPGGLKFDDDTFAVAHRVEQQPRGKKGQSQ
jgi:hypothetical protein